MIYEVSSATVPFLDINPYFKEEEDDAINDLNNEAVTNKSTVGSNYF